jgi:N-hydroxyarylamine O-acetyltransferase
METDASGRPATDEAADEADDEWAVRELDLAAYLRRIGYDADLAPTGPTLAGLHRAHVAAIPFENADIMLGRGVAVDLPSVQDKLVRRGRGGYCFEHGQLLAAALERLGYGVDRLLARVSGERDARTHLVLRVRAGEQCWVADTGFGTGLIEPLPFGDGSSSRQYGWAYRLSADGDRSWRLQERQDGRWETMYWFDDQTQHPADVVVANHFTSTYPDSSFVRQLVVIRKDTGGLRRLTGRRLSITRPGHPAEERHLDDSEFAGALTEIFGLRLSAEESARLTEITGDPGPGSARPRAHRPTSPGPRRPPT